MNKTALLALCLSSHASWAGSGGEEATWQYTVQAGDTLWSFAAKHLTSPTYVPKLQQQNGIANPYRLTPGSQLAIPYSWTRQSESSVTIEALSGAVNVQDADGQPLKAAPGLHLQAGSRISTGKDAMLKLRMADGSMLQLWSNSKLTLGKQVFYPTTGAIQSQNRLDHGSASNAVVPRQLMPNRYQIYTPSAVTTVRGTEFRVRSLDDQDTAAEVLHGKVNLAADGEELDIPAGFGGRSGGRQSVALPKAPVLDGVITVSPFNPPLLEWHKQNGEAGYQLALADAQTQQQLYNRSTETARFYPELPQNGRYLLTIRARNAQGIEGYDASRGFTLAASPLPPLIFSDAKRTSQRAQTLWIGSSASPEHPAWLQVARDPAFADIWHQGRLEQDTFALNLPDKGKWYWRLASLDDKNQPGPYGNTQELRIKAWYEIGLPGDRKLQSRRYPVAKARYTLQLARPDEPGRIIWQQGADEPAWSLLRMPSGRFVVTILVDGDGGYHAEERYPALLLP
ncbi:FecR domain-containing protein [Chromobacterium piscinae]|uniref:FecR family protein n=1 Tax=Chromobacterium piscinae TaxID=686831 RepID=UPI001E585C6C|nr:FecR domain-containing protein [Chromobacterium piscinae]MCD5326687.1 FecR domain-containing protein [Chromobacterium piscinae]